MKAIEHFWAFSPEQLFQSLHSGREGLTGNQAASLLREQQQHKKNRKPWQRDALLLLSQYSNPLVLILVLAVALSLGLGEYSNSIIIVVVLLVTGILGYLQERNAGRAVEKLQALVQSKASVKREGRETVIGLEEVAPGDIVLVKAGDMIAADALILEANDLHVNEAMLTGESYPAEKFPGYCEAKVSLHGITNAVFKGTSVINGTAILLAVNTDKNTEIGKIAATLGKNGAEHAFEKGIRQFGYLLMRLTLLIALLVVVMNVLVHKPVIDSLLFALALAVGLAPELLPAIVTITLSAGARRMALKQVIVKKLSAIQCLGEMDILCCDKTGTLTQGVMKLEAAVGLTGQASEKVKYYTYLNAVFESGFSNPIDEAIRSSLKTDTGSYTKKDEVPYDFIRKRLSVVVDMEGAHIMITKGAVVNILSCCANAEMPDGSIVEIDTARTNIDHFFAGYSEQGFRVVAVCYKDVGDDPVINKEDETGMTFLGLVVFSDPLKEGIAGSIDLLRKNGVQVKLITGDHRLVALQIAGKTGMNTAAIICGPELATMPMEALQRKVYDTDVFAEIEPAQKERIIRALQKNGHAVGFLGDGINDAGALKAADAGISIENAVDVARDAASLVLLEKNMDVILEGVVEGRKTFANTLKYIFVTTSANFGNMVSMAIASLFLPFLPLLPIQILLNNFLSDLPALAIASDKVDEEFLQKPRRWNMHYIKRFMVIFGLQSSLFDFLTFGVLLYLFHAAPDTFRTGWFIESLLTEILILLVIRTQRPFFKSRPSAYLVAASLFTFCISLALPYLPFAGIFGLKPLPFIMVVSITGIAVAYTLMSELIKKWVMRKL